jgi:hypothetical protein
MNLYAMVVLVDDKIIDWKITTIINAKKELEDSKIKYKDTIKKNINVTIMMGEEYNDFEEWFSQWEIHSDFEGIIPFSQEKNSYEEEKRKTQQEKLEFINI